LACCRRPRARAAGDRALPGYYNAQLLPPATRACQFACRLPRAARTCPGLDAFARYAGLPSTQLVEKCFHVLARMLSREKPLTPILFLFVWVEMIATIANER